MSNAFDTTCRDQIIKIAEEVLMEDERQTLTTLLAKTIPEKKIEEIHLDSNQGPSKVIEKKQNEGKNYQILQSQKFTLYGRRNGNKLKQLKILTGIKWLIKVASKKLYEITGTKPLSTATAKRR